MLEASEWMDGRQMDAWIKNGHVDRWVDRQMDGQTDR